MLTAITLDDYLAKLTELRDDYRVHLPDHFWRDVAAPWFNDIAPFKAREYGTECWLRLGWMGLMADVSACHYRWRSLRDQGYTFEDGPMRNAVIDSFGYSVMMRVFLEGDISWAGVNAMSHMMPSALHEVLLNYWDIKLMGREVPTEGIPSLCFAISYGQHNDII